MSEIDVEICGRPYRLGCDDGQEGHLRGLAARLDQHATSLNRQLGHVAEARLLLMAGLMVSDELDEKARRLKQLEEEYRDLRIKSSAARARGTTTEGGGARDEDAEQRAIDLFDAATEQIEHLVARIEVG